MFLPMNENAIKELDKLFEAVPPTELKEHVNTVFFQYLYSVQTDAMPLDFKEVCESMNFLLKFLEKVDC